MTASQNEMYDEMLRGEFRPRSTGTDADAAAAGAAPLHDEFDPQAQPAAVEEAHEEGGGPRGFARYRTAAVVGAGGVACAAVGALLGGLGGSFSTAPAAAHPLASSATTAAKPRQAARGPWSRRHSRHCRAR